jgi:elongation factor Ts
MKMLLYRTGGIIASKRCFSTNALKTLREMTGAPLIDCKNALAAAGNDIEKAKAWIAERNRAVASKISGRTAKQGLVGLLVSESAGALVEINCETDFVARGDDFQKLVRTQAEAIANERRLGDDEVVKVAGRVRENIVLGGTLRLACPKDGILGSYLHNSIGQGVGSAGAVVAIAGLSSSQKEAAAIGRAIAVQVLGTKPPYLSRDQVPAETRRAEEERILKESADALKNKPEKAKEALMKGKMQKVFADMCLLDQAFILGEFEGKIVKDVLPKGASVVGFIRMSLGGEAGSSKV